MPYLCRYISIQFPNYTDEHSSIILAIGLNLKCFYLFVVSDLIYNPLKELNTMKVHIIAISVTDQANTEILNLMAPSPCDVIKLDSYKELVERVSQITQIACPTQSK